MALSDDDVALIAASIPEPIGDDVATWVSDLCFAIEAEVREQDEALIRQLVDALENSSDLVFKDTTKADARDLAITAGRARLGRPHD